MSAKTECCGVPIAADDRFCRKCGYEARAAASDDGAAREPGLDLEPIKAELANTFGMSLANCWALIAEIERQRARIVVLETSVDYQRYIIDHPMQQPHLEKKKL